MQLPVPDPVPWQHSSARLVPRLTFSSRTCLCPAKRRAFEVGRRIKTLTDLELFGLQLDANGTHPHRR
jgi:hypothetical protein